METYIIKWTELATAAKNRLGESSFTLLDKLWYTYSYNIYNLANLPADVRDRFKHHLDSRRIMTQATMAPFAPTAHNNTSTFYLDPPPGVGTQPPDGSNRIIAINVQFFLLDSQGTHSLKAL